MNLPGNINRRIAQKITQSKTFQCIDKCALNEQLTYKAKAWIKVYRIQNKKRNNNNNNNN